MNAPKTVLWLIAGLGLGCAVGATGCAPGESKSSGRYDPSKSPFDVEYAALNEGRGDGAAVPLASGQIAVFGGTTNHGVATNTASLIRLDGGLRVDAIAAVMPVARSGLSAVLSGGLVHCVGGVDAAGIPLASIDLFDPATVTFSTSQKTLSETRVGFATLVDAASNRVFFGGGGQGDHDTVEVWTLQPFELSTVIAGIPGGVRQRPQLVLTGSGRLYLHADAASPGVWINLADGSSVAVEHDLLVGGTAVASPFDPDAVLIAGGRHQYGEGIDRLQVVRPAMTADSPMEQTEFKFSQPTEGATVLAAPEGIYTFGGTYGKKRHAVDATELTSPDAHLFLPPLVDATRGMLALRLDVRTVLLVGGFGADDRPSHAVTLIAPKGFMTSFDGAFQAAVDARAFSQKVDSDTVLTRAARNAARAEVARLQAELRLAVDERDRLVAERQRLQDALTQAQADTVTRKAEIARLEGRLPGLTAQVNQLRLQGATAQAQLNAATAARNTAQQQLNAAQSSLANAQAQVQGLTSQVGATTTSIGAAQNSIAALNTQLAAQPTFQVGAVTNLATGFGPQPSAAPGPLGFQIGAVTRLPTAPRSLLPGPVRPITSGGIGISRPTVIR